LVAFRDICPIHCLVALAVPMPSWWSRDSALLAVMLLVIAASAGDLATDFASGVHTRHLAQEAVVLMLATASLWWLLHGLRRQQREIRELRQELDQAGATRPQDDQLCDARHQLGQHIARQFREWQLTEGEREIGQLLLKGLSLREIGLLRGTSEKTVRQQASSIYQKAGLPGRHAFSAWFIEDIL